MAKQPSTEDAPTEDAPKVPVTEPRVIVAETPPRSKARWTLPTFAGIGLLVLGVLGGLLIGGVLISPVLHPGMSAGQDRAAHVLSPGDLPPGLDQLKDRMQERMHERLDERRQDRQDDRQQQRQQNGEPTLPPDDVEG